MPIYEYRCEKGHTFEAFQSMSDDALTECEVCGAPVTKVLHSPAIHFKGSGFYNTDHGTRKANKAKDAAEGDKAGAGSGSSGDSESKSDSGADSSGSGTAGSGESGSSSSGPSKSSGKSGAKVGASSKSG